MRTLRPVSASRTKQYVGGGVTTASVPGIRGTTQSPCHGARERSCGRRHPSRDDRQEEEPFVRVRRVPSAVPGCRSSFVGSSGRGGSADLARLANLSGRGRRGEDVVLGRRCRGARAWPRSRAARGAGRSSGTARACRPRGAVDRCLPRTGGSRLRGAEPAEGRRWGGTGPPRSRSGPRR